MNRLYIPDSLSLDNVSCVYLESDDSIIIQYNDNSYYKITYNNLLSDYVVEQVSYSNFDVSCYNLDLTHDTFYRKDISVIFVVVFIFTIICLYLPFRVFSRAFGRWLKL